MRENQFTRSIFWLRFRAHAEFWSCSQYTQSCEPSMLNLLMCGLENTTPLNTLTTIASWLYITDSSQYAVYQLIRWPYTECNVPNSWQHAENYAKVALMCHVYTERWHEVRTLHDKLIICAKMWNRMNSPNACLFLIQSWGCLIRDQCKMISIGWRASNGQKTTLVMSLAMGKMILETRPRLLYNYSGFLHHLQTIYLHSN